MHLENCGQVKPCRRKPMWHCWPLGQAGYRGRFLWPQVSSELIRRRPISMAGSVSGACGACGVSPSRA